MKYTKKETQNILEYCLKFKYDSNAEDIQYPGRRKDESIRRTFRLKFGLFTGVTLGYFYDICRRFNVAVLSSEKLGGFIVKDYRIELKGKRRDIRRLMCYLDDF